jgi:hypothetical protein
MLDARNRKEEVAANNMRCEIPFRRKGDVVVQLLRFLAEIAQGNVLIPF